MGGNRRLFRKYFREKEFRERVVGGGWGGGRGVSKGSRRGRWLLLESFDR